LDTQFIMSRVKFTNDFPPYKIKDKTLHRTSFVVYAFFSSSRNDSLPVIE